MLNEEGGVDPEQFRMDAMFDRMDAVGKSMLGLTIQCAQCHNHKYDPLTQEEYYRLFAFLNNDHEAQSVVYSTEEQARIAALRQQMSAIEDELRRTMPDWEQRLAAWEESEISNFKAQTSWTTLPLHHIGDNGQRYFDQDDGSIVAAGYAPTKFTAHFASQPLNDRIEALWRQWPSGSTQLVLAPRELPRDTRMLMRGDFLKPTKPVTPGFPAFRPLPVGEGRGEGVGSLDVPSRNENLRGQNRIVPERQTPRDAHQNPLPKGEETKQNATDGRLTFARWLTDRHSPTTARVIVNRVWQAYFGTGLVSTPEDFGLQSEPPSHPELLDWLAVEFMESGWSFKHLHRLITLSAMYRQSSRVTPELYERDQFNRLLARFPRQRVEGEIVRDIALTASGLLNKSLGGPAVFSPSPAFLYQPPASYGPFTWTEETGSDRYRRGLYTFRRRSTPYPMLTNFDTPNADFSCVKRTRSNTPLQALTTLNEVVFLECARSLALLTLGDGGSDDISRVTFAFRRCVSREPSETERNMLLKLLAQQRAKFSTVDAKPWELAANDPANPPPLASGVAPADAAAWTIVARVLLNLDETVTRE